MDLHPLILVLGAIGVWLVVRLATEQVKRLDGDAVEMVLVTRAEFETGRLPAVCAKSGAGAESVILVPLRRRLAVGNVPVAPSVADRYQRAGTAIR